MKNKSLSIPSTTRICDQNGVLTQEWRIWLNNLYKRVGESSAPSNSDLGTEVDNTNSGIQALIERVDINESDIVILKEKVLNNVLSINNINNRLSVTENNVTILNNDLNSLSTKVTTNTQDIATLKTSTIQNIAKLGTGIGLFKDKTSNTANFKSIKAGSNITLDNSDINEIVINSTASSYTLPVASNSVLGGVKIGSGISITSDGTISSSSSYTLPVATDTVLGGIKVGSGLSITSDGILSASGGGVNEGSGTGGVDSSTVYGKHSLEVNTTGSKNTLIGNSNLKVNTTGSRNVISGYGNLIKGVNSNDNNIHGNDNFPQLVGDLGNNLVFGSNNFKNSQYNGGISNAGNIIFGNDNFSDTKTDVPRAIISIGHGNFKNLNAAGSSNTAIGSYIFTSLTNGQNNIGIGQTGTLTQLTTGSSNTGIGNAAGTWITTGSYNYCIGLAAMQGSSSSPITGSFNVGVGFGALRNARTNSYSVGIGYQAGNYAIYDNTTSLGANSDVTGANQVQLGDSATTTYVYGTVQNRSDERDKADIIDTRLGLDFILKLRPIDFKWDMREDYVERVMGLVEKERIIYDADGNETIEKYKEHDYIKTIRHTKDGSKKRNRYHSGLSAQQLKQVCDEMGIDFGGFQDHSIDGGRDVLSIGYDEFIAPLIKSIHELHAQVNELKKLINE